MIPFEYFVLRGLLGYLRDSHVLAASLRQSPALWKVLLQLEIRTGHLREAQRIFYQAVKSCPWYKGPEAMFTFNYQYLTNSLTGSEFYLLAFGPLRSRFDTTELEQVLNAMGERGIRLRVDNSLEDHLRQDQTGRMETELDPDVSGKGRHAQDWADDDVEMYSKELKRLKPYY